MPVTLEDLIGNVPSQQTLEDQLFGNAQAAIESQSADEARRINEQTFGRGLGLSTVLADLQSGREKVRADALVKARRDAFVAANQARQTALAQAMQYQLGQQAGTRSSQALAQQAAQARQANQTAKSGQWMQAGTGLGAAAMGLGGRAFGQDITSGLKGLFGGGTPGTPAAGGGPGPGVGDVTSWQGAVPGVEMPDFSAGQTPGFDTGDLGGYDFGNLSMPTMDFGNLNWGDIGGMGLDQLIDPNLYQGWDF